MFVEALRVFAVIVILVLAALISAEKGRLPLALRGLKKMLDADRGVKEDARAQRVRPSGLKRFIAFLLVLAAVALALV